MKKILIIIQILIGLFKVTYPCDCVTRKLIDAQIEDFSASKFIFIGNVIEFTKDSFFVVVKETFKGNIELNRQLAGVNMKYCTPIINRKGDWLFYVNIDNDKIKIESCSITANIEEPYESRFLFYLISIPPPEIETLSSRNDTLNKKMRDVNEQIAKNDIIKEIEQLRNNKININKN